jgi:hypothetical protein
MAPLRQLLPWVDALTGIDPDRAHRAIERIAEIRVPALTARLGKPHSVDDVVRAVLLTEDMDELIQRGVQENKLISKLRDAGQFEATWAEMRFASLIAKTADSDVALELESGKAEGAHADVRLVLPEGPPHASIEVKALGLSQSELEFCQRMGPSLDEIIPPVGLVSASASLDGSPPIWTAELGNQTRIEAAELTRQVPGYPPGLSGAVLIARETEEGYMRRAASRVERALHQLPPTDDCWVGLYWTNGAPVRQVVRAIDWEQIPEHVLGLIFAGSVVAFPDRNIHWFTISIARDYTNEDLLVESMVDNRMAELVLDRTEASAAVRATLLRGEIRRKRRTILRRDGTERILPFNLILDRDPVGPLMSGRAAV